MAVLALALGGALLAPAIGIGANIGWIVGAVVGQLLFPAEGPADTFNEGPRLGDLSVTSSAFGAPRAIGYGTIRMGGNVIWSTGIDEHKEVTRTQPQSSGGKGGGGGKKGGGGPAIVTTTYTYSADFAVAFGEGEAAGVRRIWMDGKLVMDTTGNSLDTLKSGFTYRFYPGNETQEVDSLLAADTGATSTPAHRGTCYIVFDNIPLQDFGNRIPNVTAEITYQGILSRPESIETYRDTIFGAAVHDGEAIAIDWDRQQMFTTTHTPSGITRSNLASGITEQYIDSTYLTADTINSADGQMLGVLPTGQLLAQVGGTNNTVPVVLLDDSSYREVARFGTTETFLAFTTTTSLFCKHVCTGWLTGAGSGVSVAMLGNGSVDDVPVQFLRIDGNSIAYIWDSDTFPLDFPSLTDTWLYACTGNQSTESTFFYQLGYLSTNRPVLELLEYNVSGAAEYQVFWGATGGVVARIARDFDPTDFDPSWTGGLLFSEAKCVWDTPNQQLLIWAKVSSVSTGRLIAYDPFANVINWICDTDIALMPTDDIHNSRLNTNTVGWMSTKSAFIVDTVTGVMIDDASALFSKTVRGGAYDSQSQMFAGVVNDDGAASQEVVDGPLGRYFFNRFSSGTDTVGAVVADICDRVGLDSTEYDTTDLNAIAMPGYFLGRQVSGRGAIEPLAQFFLFDGFESDFKLKFQQRGQASSRTITQDQLAIKDEKSGDVLHEARAQEVELPSQWSVNYMDKDADHTQATQTARRIQNPTPAMQSKNKVGISMNMALSNTVAKQQMEKTMYSAWVERANYSLKFPWEQLDLDPSDVVTIELDDGVSFEMRLAKLNMGTSFVIDADGVSQRPSQFTSTITATNATGVKTQAIRSSHYTQTWVVDSPLLVDSHDEPTRAATPQYCFQSGFSDDQYSRGRVFYSQDGLTYGLGATLVTETPYGSCITAMPDPPWNNPYAPDEVSTLDIVVNVGADLLVSVTDAELLSGSNAALLIKDNGEVEVIQYRDVTDNSDGTYTLSYFHRGRRGTDTMTNDHTTGQKILFLNAGGDQVGEPHYILNDRDGLTVYYRGQGAQQIFQQAQQIDYTTNLRGLMPYAPTPAAANSLTLRVSEGDIQRCAEDGTERSCTAPGGDDIAITWSRRNRTSGHLRNQSGDIPMTESTLEYEIDVYSDSTFTTVVSGGTGTGAQTGLVTEEAIYLDADIDIDFPGGIGPYLYCRIYQISAEVGRGFSRDHVLEIDSL